MDWKAIHHHNGKALAVIWPHCSSRPHDLRLISHDSQDGSTVFSVIWNYEAYGGMKLNTLSHYITHRTFNVSGPRIWNGLPQDVVSAITLSSFQRQL